MSALTMSSPCDQLLEEVDGDGLVGRQVGLHLQGHEVVDLALGPVLGGELTSGNLVADCVAACTLGHI